MKKWTLEEIEILKDNYGQSSKKELSVLLSGRTWGTSQVKASKLKLSFYGTPEQRLWRQVDKNQNHECWNWTGLCSLKGYGRIGINKKIIRTHRFSWEIHFGKIPKDLYVLHTCDNRKCVNPKHLFLGTQQDNMNDKINKNRQSKGEDRPSAKLTKDQVKEIRNLKDKFSQREIAKIFNVTHGTIGYIYRNKTWKHVI